MFWRKKEVEKKAGETVAPGEETEQQKKKRRSSPRDGTDRITASPIYNYLKEKYGVTDQQVTNLRWATWDGMVADKPVTIFRIFNPADAIRKGINEVVDYHTLDSHADLILYEGYWSGNVRAPDPLSIEKKK